MLLSVRSQQEAAAMASSADGTDTCLTTCSSSTTTTASSTISDCESTVVADGVGRNNSPFFSCPPSSSSLVPLPADSREHVLLKHRVYVAGLRCSVESACRVAYPPDRVAARARLQAFRMRAEDAGTSMAWYGAGSQEEVARIAREGFAGVLAGGGDKDRKQAAVRLWPEDRVGNSIASSRVDSRGLRHILLCQVIVRSGVSDAAMEGMDNGGVIFPPSDCKKRRNGDADTAKKARCYVLRDADAATFVLPLYAVAVKMATKPTPSAAPPFVKKPTSPWIPLVALVNVLSQHMPQERVCLIKRLHNAYVERKITRQHMIHRVRQLSGDKILVQAIRAFQTKIKMATNKSAAPQKDRSTRTTAK